MEYTEFSLFPCCCCCCYIGEGSVQGRRRMRKVTVLVAKGKVSSLAGAPQEQTLNWVVCYCCGEGFSSSCSTRPQWWQQVLLSPEGQETPQSVQTWQLVLLLQCLWMCVMEQGTRAVTAVHCHVVSPWTYTSTSPKSVALMQWLCRTTGLVRDHVFYCLCADEVLCADVVNLAIYTFSRHALFCLLYFGQYHLLRAVLHMVLHTCHGLRFGLMCIQCTCVTLVLCGSKTSSHWQCVMIQGGLPVVAMKLSLC